MAEINQKNKFVVNTVGNAATYDAITKDNDLLYLVDDFEEFNLLELPIVTVDENGVATIVNNQANVYTKTLINAFINETVIYRENLTSSSDLDNLLPGYYVKPDTIEVTNGKNTNLAKVVVFGNHSISDDANTQLWIDCTDKKIYYRVYTTEWSEWILILDESDKLDIEGDIETAVSDYNETIQSLISDMESISSMFKRDLLAEDDINSIQDIGVYYKSSGIDLEHGVNTNRARIIVFSVTEDPLVSDNLAVVLMWIDTIENNFYFRTKNLVTEDWSNWKQIASASEIPIIDSTLTELGLAADAKATGDDIRTINHDLLNKANTSDVTTALQGKADAAETTLALASKVNKDDLASAEGDQLVGSGTLHTRRGQSIENVQDALRVLDQDGLMYRGTLSSVDDLFEYRWSGRYLIDTGALNSPATDGGVGLLLNQLDDSGIAAWIVISKDNKLYISTQLDRNGSWSSWLYIPDLGQVETSIENAISTYDNTIQGLISEIDQSITNINDTLPNKANLSDIPAIDDTLEISGDAADAKVTGQRIKELDTGKASLQYVEEQLALKANISLVPDIDNTLLVQGDAADSKAVGDALEKIMDASLVKKTLSNKPIAQCSDGAEDILVKSLIANIDYNSEGYTQLNLLLTGKNIVDYNSFRSWNGAAVTVTPIPSVNGIQVSGYITSSDLLYGSAYIYLQAKAGITYTVSCDVEFVGEIKGSAAIRLRNDHNSVLSAIFIDQDTLNSVISWTCGSDQRIKLNLYCNNGVDPEYAPGNTVIFKNIMIQVSEGSVSDYTYESYTEDQHAIDFGRTIYGGTLDIINGILTETVDSDNQPITPIIHEDIDPVKVKTFLGINNISVDTGYINELTYRCDATLLYNNQL